jgi:hypothetical protein
MISEGSGEVQDNVRDDPGFSWVIAAIAFVVGWLIAWSLNG